MTAISPADGPVAVTGASGYIASWIVRDLMEQGYQVRGCVRDRNKQEKVQHLLAMNDTDLRGTVDLVEVDLRGPELPVGFYVPEEAIQFDGSAHHVFVLGETAENGKAEVRKVSVTPGQTSRELRGVTGEGLEAGTRVVLGGAHYVEPGEQVAPVEQVELRP